MNKTHSAYQQFYQKLEKGLANFLPPKSLPIIIDWLLKYEVHLKITRSRLTKLADYRPPFGKHGHRISINNDLNPYAFLYTLVHEIAHLVTYLQFKQSVKPHGLEWKNNYKNLIGHFLNVQIFPEEVETAIKKHLSNPPASSCTNPTLYKVLKKYDAQPKAIISADGQPLQKIFLENVPIGQRFMTQAGRIFVKGKIIRKRYECVEFSTKRRFAFSPIAEVYIPKS